MTEDDIIAIRSLISSPKKIVVVPHKNPDGDAMGSCLGLYHYLKKHGQEVTVIAPNDYPEFLKWMPADDLSLKYELEKDHSDQLIKEADIIFTLDFNALNRVGDMEQILTESSAIKIMIDHHQEPADYATYMYSDVQMSSTCEMVYNFITCMGDQSLIDENIATCLYTGMMTDTGSFRFPSTTSETHRVVAYLIEQGANHSEIYNNVFDTNSFDRMQLLGRALNNLKVKPEYRTAFITLSQEELNQYNYKKGDTEGFVNYALSIENIAFAAIFIEDKGNDIIKISLRSKGTFSVNAFAREHFKGGGHINAAGGRSELSLEATVEKFISILPNYLKALNNA
ncbi:DHH family phosphoesterase [Mangrovimonas futianensis]|uniref:DHH family phosphoesterase n=1 Tax=Mangrovimonas futianensis TaxID=2895523 RepID=UPI001E564ED9|nr:bifunctional oligoribonuclease/PAP phosphatase NrnA [Mangrovimonas futianensis]MCF1422212.1 bifunctional oligoribonuclease/PAP phosphatase NrnA [Mangrovimonas futianensis]